MKLLDVLAKELKEWPEGGYSVGQATDGTLHVNNKHGILLYHTTEAYSQPDAGEYYTDEITKDMWERAKLKSTLDSLQSKHKHAEMIALCAEFAQTMENPMLMFQFKDCGAWVDFDLDSNLAFYNHREYRLKPKTHIVHGVEIPDLRIDPKEGDRYYLADPTEPQFTHNYGATGDSCDILWVERGLCYEDTEEGKQAAILHAKAWLGIA